MTTPPEGWEGILAPGETILWQARPSGAVMWSDLFGFQSAFGLLSGHRRHFQGFAVQIACMSACDFFRNAA